MRWDTNGLTVRAVVAMTSICKIANALIPDAMPATFVPRVARKAAERLRTRYGGIWVGGRVAISSEGISFTPNRLNEVFHMTLQPVRIAFADIRSVKREFGVLTGIVVVHHKQGEFRFRCFGATRVAAFLSEQLK